MSAPTGHRPVGTSGLVVSTVGLGCNNFGLRLGLDGARPVIEAALDAGVTLFDTSDSYGDSEEILGTVLAGRRDRVVIATKFGSDLQGANGPDWGARAARRYVRRAVERSLRRLRTDWIDLYQLHRPDGVTPMEETLAALRDLVHEGKVRYIGSSNLRGWQVSDAYFPLASGLLTGKYRRGEAPPPDSRFVRWGMTAQLSDERFDVVDALAAYAAERSISLLDVAVGGLAAQPAVASVIAGATTPDQVRANVAAGAWAPSADDLAALDAIVPSARP